MIRLKLTDQEIEDIKEALDDPATSDKHKIKLLVIRMHSEGAKHGFIAKCLNLHNNTITNQPRNIRLESWPPSWKIATTSPPARWNRSS